MDAVAGIVCSRSCQLWTGNEQRCRYSPKLLIFSIRVFTCSRSEAWAAFSVPCLGKSLKHFGYSLTMCVQIVRHSERDGLGLISLISSTSVWTIWSLLFLGGLWPSLMAESISMGILFHGTWDTWAHGACAAVATSDSDCGDGLRQAWSC